MEKFEDLGPGNLRGARKMRNTETNELVFVKFIPRGEQINAFMEWQILNHWSLTHPNVIRFKEVVLTPTDLAIIMEHADNGALSDGIANTSAGRLREDEARKFFQELICGVSYCHSMQICNHDLKLDSILLHGSLPQLKICNFGYTQSSLLRSLSNLTVDKVSYVAPEILHLYGYHGELRKFVNSGKDVLTVLGKVGENRPLLQLESNLNHLLKNNIQAITYAKADLDLKTSKWTIEKINRLETRQPLSNGQANFREELSNTLIPRFLANAKLADVWSCGVALCLMLVGDNVFEDPDNSENLAKTIERIMSAQYKIPDHLCISQDCHHLIANIFVVNPAKRITMEEIKQHPWFLKDLPLELSEAAQAMYCERDNIALIQSSQTKEEIMHIVNEAKNLPPPLPEVEEGQLIPEVEEEELIPEEDTDWYQDPFETPHAR